MKVFSRGPALVTLLGLLAVLWTVFPPSPDWVERHYANGLYRTLSASLIPVSDLVPFSLTGAIFALLAFVVLALAVRSWRRRRSARDWLRLWSLRAVSASVVLYVLFLFVWGANYQRPPLETRLALASSPATAEEVADLALHLSRVVSQALPAARDEARALASLRSSLLELVTAWEERAVTLPERVKKTPPGLLLTLGNASGVISPFTLEAHVDGALPAYKYLAVATHELSHLAGYSGEAEADFVAAVAGLRAADAFARYATALSLFETVARQLPDDIYLQVYKTLPAEAVEDLQRTRAVALHYQILPLVRLQTVFYNGYLRAQGVAEGIADYGRVTDLLVAAAREGIISLD